MVSRIIIYEDVRAHLLQVTYQKLRFGKASILAEIG